MPIVSSYTVAQSRQPNHLGAFGRCGLLEPVRLGATWRTCSVRPRGPVRTPWERRAPQRGRSARGPLLTGGTGAFAPRFRAKMENAPNPKQAASRHQLGQFQPHMALRAGRLVALTGPTRATTSRSLTRIEI
jgi:hypothetical protein